MVSMFQYILPMWSECIPHNAHVVRVSHSMMCQSTRSTWSVCFSIYCPCGQSVSRYDVSIYAVYMVRMYHHIALMWSECIPCNVHVVRVYHHMPYQLVLFTWSVWITTYCHVVIVSHNIMYQSALSTWPVCFSIYCPCGRSVSHIMLMWSECFTIYCSRSQSVSPYIAHVVMCPTMCCINSYCSYGLN
jgi:hypothetical protein